ncbi:hypothetical protein [Thermococcus sibiricus]|uniref:Endo-beta 1,4-glucanase (Extracellular) n=1 Tax=Thermococcus sibiricus (strain DSM 12597 / MM 739) TaxID=604354 RepID=C6A199_THESM|nr:hypothetical protein [Thermococcus sibiricus]ACS89394.1 endo-beta 1,4-glucanase (extracellular) [Thermococcus sibiricus MM 739]
MALRGKLKHLTGVFLILVLLGGYVAATTLSEIKEVAKSSEQGDITLQWSPSNPWPGQIVQRSDGTTIYMEPNFWNIASGDGENYMRFISSEDTIAFYANMSNIERTYTETAPRWDGSTSPIDALATPNVIFVGRAPAAWWGDKPLVGGYDFFSLPVNGADVSTLGEVWARVDFEMAKSEETLARTGLIMWFESPDWDPYGTGKAWPLAEVYIAFQDDFFYDDHEKNLQYPPADIGTLTATVYVNGAPKEVEFKVQRAWNADHFVIKFVPTEPITTGGSVTLNVTPFAERSIQAIVDDPYSDWTADQITWTSIGFGTYTGSNGNSFELGWILKEAGVFESLKEALFYKVKNLSTEAEPGDVVLQWTSGDYWAPPYDDNGVTRQVCTWPGQLVTRSDNTTLWVEPNFWNIAGGDGENYMRFISSEDTVVFYVNMTNIQTRYGGIAWATPNVVLAGRVPPSLSGGTPLPRAGGYGWFDLPMPAKDRTNYASILAKVDFELVKSENTLVRP